ncbi:MAG: ABC transporter substrate-binding protein, partial [Bacteroidales bacterium]|nr:ABC transporter substrate-binding protein [Bacteroidales bacterium]
MRITKKLFYFLVAMFATVMLFNSCNDDDDDDDSSDKNLYLGAILFLDADDGEMHKDAVNFAVGEINDAGGLLDGYNLKLDIRSSEPQGDNDRATQAALVAEDVIKTNPNTIGFITSGSSGAKGIVEEVGNTYKIGSISGWSSANSNSGLSSYFHRTCPPNKYNIDILVQEAWNYGLKKIAVAKVEGDEWSSSFEASFREKWIAKGGTMADTVSFKENDTEY